MARFLVKASEFKNVCKAVNDRKLAELKKEIIEILKKQDENEVKKAVDYFNSQELHYSHLEKSLVSGKWIEKAGYGVGTVRIWKGKKYKKIAPGKWARVFDKEGRGTNIAIGKLIAKVNKIDNAEDLLQFVMENKQRFIDEEGKELSIINKVRAAVDARNEKLSGESKPYVYGVGEEVNAAKNEMFSKKDKITKEEADLHKISRKYSQIPTSELKQRKAKLDRWIENKTRNKREHLNNAIFRDSYKNEVEAINKELEKRSKRTVDNKVLDKYKTDAKNMTTEQLEYYVEDLKNGTGNIGKENLEERIKIYSDELNKRKGISKPAEKYDDDKAYKEYQKLLMKENPTDADNERLGELVTEHYKHSKKEWIGGQGLKELNAAKDEDEVLSNGKTVKEVREQYGIESEKPAEKNTEKVSSKEEIGTFEKVDDKTVEMAANKSTKELFDLLNKSRSDDDTREFMTDCYYDGENIVSTDGKRMTIIKAENIGLEPGYVSVKTDGGKIRLESMDKKGLRLSFPNYKGVMPIRNNQEVKLDNNALKEKLKEMKKEGKYSDKKSPKIALNFENGKVMLDGVPVGTADGVKFNDSYQKIVVNAQFLKDALTSGDFSSLFVSDNPNKAVVIKTDVSDAIVMPFRNDTEVDYENEKTIGSDTTEKPDIKSMSNDELKEYEAKLEKELLEMGNRNSPDYMEKYSHWREVHAENNDRFHQGIEDEVRAEKQKAADAKAEKEKEIKERYNGYFDNRSGLDKARDLKLLEKKYNFDGKVMSQKEFVEQAIDNGAEIKEREVNKLEYPSRTRWNRMNGYEQDEYERRIKEAGKKTVYSINGYEFPKSVVDYAKFYSGKKVEKSLFDDFIMDVFAADDEEEIEDAIKADETEYNDYSAEQPELFNSTSMKVREALDRIKNQVL